MIPVCICLAGSITSYKVWKFQSHIYTTVSTKNFRSIPWINNEIKKAMRKRNILWRHLKQNNASTATDRIRYTSMRNKVVALLRDSKHPFFFEKLSNSTTTRMLNRRASTISYKMATVYVVIESNTGKANGLNSFFHSCFNYSFPPLSEFPITAEPN